MTSTPTPELIPYESRWLAALVPMWRASFEAGVGIVDPNPLSEQHRYFLEQVEPKFSVQLAVADRELIGFVAASSECISQLYVRVGCQRAGVGSQMLQWAKRQASGNLWLYTFARNGVACAFYEKHGFVAVARGFEPHWQLEDVRYEWSDQRQSAV